MKFCQFTGLLLVIIAALWPLPGQSVERDFFLPGGDYRIDVVDITEALEDWEKKIAEYRDHIKESRQAEQRSRYAVDRAYARMEAAEHKARLLLHLASGFHFLKGQVQQLLERNEELRLETHPHGPQWHRVINGTRRLVQVGYSTQDQRRLEMVLLLFVLSELVADESSNRQLNENVQRVEEELEVMRVRLAHYRRVIRSEIHEVREKIRSD